MQRVLDREQESDVPCDGCTACCRSAQFILVEPDETDTLAHIPRRLLFPAPRMPEGHMVLGHDENGHCPMLVDDRCSIYEHRPRTCRIYDCRVFAATGVESDKPAIAERVRRWRFEYASDDDRDEHAALRARAAELVGDEPHHNPGQVAVFVIRSRTPRPPAPAPPATRRGG